MKVAPLTAALLSVGMLLVMPPVVNALPDGVTATGKVKVSKSTGVVQPSLSVTNPNPYSSSVPRVRFRLKNAILNYKARTCAAAVPSAFDFPVSAFVCPQRSRVATGRFRIRVIMIGTESQQSCNPIITGSVNVFNHHEPPLAEQFVNEFVIDNAPDSFNRIYSTNVDNFSTSSTTTVVLDVPNFWNRNVDASGTTLETLYEQIMLSSCGFYPPDIGYSVESISLKYDSKSKIFKRKRAGKKVTIRVDLGDEEHHDPISEPGL